MIRRPVLAALTGTALLLAGCSWFDTREIPTLGPEGTAAATTGFGPVAVTPGTPTGTTAGNEIEAIRTELMAVQDTVGTAGPAIQAGGDLSQTESDVVAAAAQVQNLADRAQAVDPAANAEDQRQLATLQQEIQQTAAVLDRMASAIAGGGVSAMAGAEAPEGTAGVASAPLPGVQAAGPGAGLAGGRPFVVIRFADPGVQYRSELRAAVAEAIRRSPTVAFDVVAVTPSVSSGNIPQITGQARDEAAAVMRSITEMGVSPDRVAVTAMSSDTAATNEVHVYVR
jgi:hypothetical protein